MSEQRILVGVVGRAHGVRGLVRVHSYTADPADLAAYDPLVNEAGRRFALRWSGEGGVAELFTVEAGERRRVADRAAAERLTNTRLYVARAQLAAPDEDEFYLADLVGLAAVDPSGVPLGRVETVHDYGAGASLEIGPHFVPFTRACVPLIDIAGGRVTIALPHEIEVPAPAVPSQARGAGEAAP